MQKRAPKGTYTPQPVPVTMRKAWQSKRAKRRQKDAKKKQWIPAGTVNGGKSSAEKACKMSKKRQKGDRHPPWCLEGILKMGKEQCRERMQKT